MRSATMCIAFVLICTSGSFVAGLRYIDPQPGNNGDIGDKRVDLTEPSCDELRAMWRYTKRQSRAAKTTNGYPMYPFNPERIFNPDLWQSGAGFPDHKFSRGYAKDPLVPTRLKLPDELEARHAGRPRSRNAAGAPIYGRIMHKAPATSKWRNAMRGPSRARVIENLSRHYGTINLFTPNSHRITSFRVGGGISPPKTQIPQAGSFDALKNIIQAERARELQEQHLAEIEAEVAAYRGGKEVTDEGQEPNRDLSRKYFSNPLEVTPKVNYDYNSRRYTPNIGQAWSRSEPLRREYLP